MGTDDNDVTEQAIGKISVALTALQQQLGDIVKDTRYRHDQKFKDEADKLDAKRIELCTELDAVTERAFQANKEKMSAAIALIKEVQDKIQFVLSGVGTALQLAEAAEVLAKVVLPFAPII
jgi:hypothetical protein